MRLSVADRRAVMTSAYQPGFRAALQQDPRKMIANVTGHKLPSDMRIELMEEDDDLFCFVTPYPGSIEAELPAALDARSMVENDVYAMLRKDPSLQSAMQKDPKGFLRDALQVDIGSSDVLVKVETESTTVIVIPSLNAREELPDELLDLVSAGGDTGCQSGLLTASRQYGGG
jgi:hypothetical protein